MQHTVGVQIHFLRVATYKQVESIQRTVTSRKETPGLQLWKSLLPRGSIRWSRGVAAHLSIREEQVRGLINHMLWAPLIVFLPGILMLLVWGSVIFWESQVYTGLATGLTPHLASPWKLFSLPWTTSFLVLIQTYHRQSASNSPLVFLFPLPDPTTCNSDSSALPISKELKYLWHFLDNLLPSSLCEWFYLNELYHHPPGYPQLGNLSRNWHLHSHSLFTSAL